MKLSTMYQGHRSRFISRLRARRVPLKNTIAIFKGSYRFHHYDTSNTYTPKYDQNFVYLFGVEDFGYDGFIDLANAQSFLIKSSEKVDGFLLGDKRPVVGSEYKKWVEDSTQKGELTNDEVKTLYGIEKIMSYSEFLEYLAAKNPDRIYVNHGTDTYTNILSNSYDDANVLEKYQEKIDRDTLYPVLNEARTYKTQSEAEFMRKIGMISSQAHIDVMQACKPGMKEHQIAAIFYVE